MIFKCMGNVMLFSFFNGNALEAIERVLIDIEIIKLIG